MENAGLRLYFLKIQQIYKTMCAFQNQQIQLQFHYQLNKAINMPDSVLYALVIVQAHNHHFIIKLLPLLIRPVSNSGGKNKV